jgi:hypothetical protein
MVLLDLAKMLQLIADWLERLEYFDSLPPAGYSAWPEIEFGLHVSLHSFPPATRKLIPSQPQQVLVQRLPHFL